MNTGIRFVLVCVFMAPFVTFKWYCSACIHINKSIKRASHTVMTFQWDECPDSVCSSRWIDGPKQWSDSLPDWTDDTMTDWLDMEADSTRVSPVCVPVSIMEISRRPSSSNPEDYVYGNVKRHSLLLVQPVAVSRRKDEDSYFQSWQGFLLVWFGTVWLRVTYFTKTSGVIIWKLLVDKRKEMDARI